jgi:hypothetical protein
MSTILTVFFYDTTIVQKQIAYSILWEAGKIRACSSGNILPAAQAVWQLSENLHGGSASLPKARAENSPENSLPQCP